MNYCTIFDSAYISRGLLCHKSLLNVEPEAHLYIFCLDIKCADVLKAENLMNCTVLYPKDFECDDLLGVKAMRTNGEYAWTVKPYAINYIFTEFNAEECAYIDADLYFYAAPKILSACYERASVVLTPHNFSSKYDTSEQNGIYCAQFIKFSNDTVGRSLLMWWKKKCLEWCYNRHEPGRYGDQKYLEHIAMQHSVAVANSFCFAAPWNIIRYKFIFEEGVIFAIDRESGESKKVVFFHFHSLKLLNRFSVDLGGYNLPRFEFLHFYRNYIKELRGNSGNILMRYKVDSIDGRRRTFSIANLLRAARNWLIRRYRISF
jgi:hypothetical protein